jgi:hypothetical protein
MGSSPVLRCRPPSWVRGVQVFAAGIYWLSETVQPSRTHLCLALLWTGLAAAWCFGMDTVVDEHGVRRGGRWLRRHQVTWAEVVDVTARSGLAPVLTRRDGRETSLPFVPHESLGDVRERWLAAREDAPADG